MQRDQWKLQEGDGKERRETHGIEGAGFGQLAAGSAVFAAKRWNAEQRGWILGGMQRM
jgi:hypothetical protein